MIVVARIDVVIVKVDVDDVWCLLGGVGPCQRARDEAYLFV